MVVHTCNRCKIEFNKKSTYVNHLKKKNPCKEIIEEHAQKSDTVNNVEEILVKPAKNLQNIAIHNETPAKLECNFCKKIFTRSDNLKVHVDSSTNRTM